MGKEEDDMEDPNKKVESEEDKALNIALNCSIACFGLMLVLCVCQPAAACAPAIVLAGIIISLALSDIAQNLPRK